MKVLFLFLILVLICVPAVAQKSLPAIKFARRFDRISVIWDANTPFALPHVMFVIDRRTTKIYYVNKEALQFSKTSSTAYLLARTRPRVFHKQLSEAEPALHSEHSLIKLRCVAGRSNSGKAIW